jgi:hypothetical protein
LKKVSKLYFSIYYQVNGQRLVYKFVELPYNYKPMKNSALLTPEHEDIKPNVQQQENGVETTPMKTESLNKPTQPDFKVTQEPINGKLSEHVTHEPVSRVIISKPTPVIVRCGRPRALNRHVPACANP